ncbi:MAG: hypothetical protein NTV96_07165 [Actinobacteria bacterium]|nr:hypothetical protein [Actinomycetota bacterium]
MTQNFAKVAAGSRLGPLTLDAVIVAAISIFSAFLSGSRQWVGFNSPDSEFYASLALFGNEVTDRAIDPAYFWTRLGFIAPVRGLTSLLGPWAGFALWRFLLIALIAASLYWLIRQVSSRKLASVIALFAALNTMVLSYVGNPYLTGTILAATLLFIALGTWCTFGTPRISWLPAFISGATAAWLLMLNPYACFLALSMWVGIRLVGVYVAHTDRWRALLFDTVAAIAGFAVSLLMFIALGLLLFPGLNWVSTYLYWNGRLDYTDFISDPTIWASDIALLVPLSALVIATISAITTRGDRWAVTAVVIASTNIAFTAIYYALVPGPWLEAPHYIAKLWPGSLAAIGLAAAALLQRRNFPASALLVPLAAVPLLLWSGRWAEVIERPMGVMIVLLICLGFLVAASITRRSGNFTSALAVLVALAITAIGMQLLQNGRGLMGIYGQYPFRAAYVDFSGEQIMREKIKAEQWIIDNTSAADTVGRTQHANRYRHVRTNPRTS